MPQRNKPRSRLLPVVAVLCGAFALLAGLPAPAHAQTGAQQAERSFEIDLPAQPLGSALNELSRQTGAQIFAAGELVSGHAAPAVSGRLSLEQALGRLLAGSGLSARRSGADAFSVVQAGEAVLSTVTISGKGVGATTEGTGSYTTWSTSSSTRLNLTPQETPQSVTVMTRQRMDDQRLNSLNDVLDAAVGVTMKPLGHGADGPQMWARGSSITNFQIDGVPVSSSMSNYLQSTAMYDRVEIVKGATGIMSGLGTPAATINMIRKRPTKAPQTRISAEAGNWSRYGVGLDLSRPLNEDASVRGRLVVDYKRDGAWTDNYRQDYGVLYGIGEVDLGPRTLLTAGFSHITRNTDSPIRSFDVVYTNGQPTGAKPSNGASPDWIYYDHQVNSVFGSIEHTFGSGWSAKAELTHGRYKYDALIASLVGNGVDQATGLGAMAQISFWGSTTEQTSLDAYVTGPFSLFGRQHELIGGVTLSRLEQDSPGYPSPARQNITDLFNWANELSEPTRGAQTSKTTSKQYQVSAYLNARLQLSDATSLLLGSRLINWKLDRDAVTYSSGNVDAARLRENNIFVPYVGIVHALNDTYSLYASYTQIFNPQPYYVIDIDGNLLDPEEGTSYEAGIKASFNGGALTSSLSLFRTRQDTFPVWDGVTRTYTAIDDTITEGVEVELAGELANGWQLGAGYTYSETRDKDDVRLMTRIPRNTAKLFTSYRLPGEWNRLTLGGGVNWESESGEAAYTQDSYALLNLMARYQINKQLSVAAHLNNALDKRYLMGVAGTRGVYGPPRNFMVSAKYSF
ncbi:TonB-dependent siderophore receptor [Pseudothauera nasutitermitis]|uniref:TonB-dependent siderophore receptor n=1 Tax=Pseudothauera nasutitermitis TaxID=2565930 RepID=A0A4S4ASU6_9RHOO|nr:TonB-dependent receptor [Pseudothauera nasutitermitis]THF62953.1 TonB-dependent siderophore receptor [Pseudothauera nasutitermitis]